MPLKRSPCRNLPLLAMCQRKKKTITSMKTPVTKSSLNLPPLVTYQKLNYCDKEDDINQLFLKLSPLHSKLPDDPLKELLSWCACEDEGIGYTVSHFGTGRELDKEVYSSPRPDHVPLMKRISSNKIANEHKGFGVYRQDAPMATVTARWIPNSLSTQYDQQSVLQELAKFGDIESVTPFGRQTIIVTFKELCSACKAVSAFPSDGPDRGMRCFWHHNFMSQYKRLRRPKRRMAICF